MSETRLTEAQKNILRGMQDEGGALPAYALAPYYIGRAFDEGLSTARICRSLATRGFAKQVGRKPMATWIITDKGRAALSPTNEIA